MCLQTMVTSMDGCHLLFCWVFCRTLVCSHIYCLLLWEWGLVLGNNNTQSTLGSFTPGLPSRLLIPSWPSFLCWDLTVSGLLPTQCYHGLPAHVAAIQQCWIPTRCRDEILFFTEAKVHSGKVFISPNEIINIYKHLYWNLCGATVWYWNLWR